MGDTPVHHLITDSDFRRGVDLMDAGDLAGLRAHLLAHPDLITARTTLNQSGYFAIPSLLAFIAENPVRHGALPKNVLDVLDLLLAAGPDQAALDDTIGLVSSGRVMRETGFQSGAIARLAQAGADPDAAMLAALTHGEFGAAEALIAAGALISLPYMAATGDAKTLMEAIHKVSQLERHQALALAAQFGHAEVVRALIQADEDPNKFNPPGCHAHTTPLHQAVYYGHLEAVQALIENGARADIGDKNHDATALSWAHHAGQTQVAAYLSALSD